MEALLLTKKDNFLNPRLEGLVIVEYGPIDPKVFVDYSQIYPKAL